MILADKKKAAELDTDFSSEEILAVLNDPDVGLRQRRRT
jgi:hypothetical protein